MTADLKRSRHLNVWKSIYRALFALGLIVLISPLASCMPPAPATQPPTQPLQATPTEIPVESPVVSSQDATAMPTPTPTLLTFIADADAWVDESNRDENNGEDVELQSDGEDESAESLLRFRVTGIEGTVQNAILRVHATGGSRNGPTVYLSDPDWEESEVTWETRPERQGGALDNKDRIPGDTWVEYNVTSQVTQDGTFSFVFVADSGDGTVFSSREGAFPPELVITVGGSMAPTPTLQASAEILVGAGDISMCDNDNDELTAQLLDNIPGTVFTTGDNAYPDGTYQQFIECYDPTWGRHKDRTRPVPGNHEYLTDGAAGYFEYFENIPPYYAYDLGSWRIYALNSEIDVTEESEQVQWLLEDLAANPRQCVLAYWHEPRWSSGRAHGSSRSMQTLWRTMYEAGAELVLNGHEHSYERFAPMNARGEPDPQGLREIVVGTGGRSTYNFDPPLPASEVRDNTGYGVLKLTLYDGGYDWEFIPAAGTTFTDSGSDQCH